jgi:hypothetical protein
MILHNILFEYKQKKVAFRNKLAALYSPAAVDGSTAARAARSTGTPEAKETKCHTPSK